MTEELIPTGKWDCPGCGKTHSGPHYSHPGQVDYSISPGNPGRVKFNRRKKDDSLDESCPVDYNYMDEPSEVDEEGYQKPLFCPHCGWEQDWLVINRIGARRGLIDQFLDVVNGDIDTMDARLALQQFMGFLKGRGEVE